MAKGPEDNDQRDLSNRLFASATALLEDAIELAVAGQSSKHTTEELVDLGRRLRTVAGDVAALAEAAVIVAGDGASRDRPER